MRWQIFLWGYHLTINEYFIGSVGNVFLWKLIHGLGSCWFPSISESRIYVRFSFSIPGKNTLKFQTKAQFLCLEEKKKKQPTMAIYIFATSKNQLEGTIYWQSESVLSVKVILSLLKPLNPHSMWISLLISEHINCGQCLFCSLKAHGFYARLSNIECVQVPYNLLPLSLSHVIIEKCTVLLHMWQTAKQVTALSRRWMDG